MNIDEMLLNIEEGPNDVVVTVRDFELGQDFACDINIGPCWLWLRGVVDGYGVAWHEGQDKRVCRLLFEHWMFEPMPDGYVPDHLCRCRCCVNPFHLEAVTFRENVLRGDSVQARNAAKTHCDNGHPFDEANTIIREEAGRAHAGRRCRTCARESKRESVARDPLRKEKARAWTRAYRERQANTREGPAKKT